MNIPTIATDVYPTRYTALENPGHWAIFEPVDGLYRPSWKDAQPRQVSELGAYKRGGEMAVLHLPQQNEHYSEIVDGTYVEVIKNSDTDYFARCTHTRPTRDRVQVNASLRASNRDAIAAAEKWIAMVLAAAEQDQHAGRQP